MKIIYSISKGEKDSLGCMFYNDAIVVHFDNFSEMTQMMPMIELEGGKKYKFICSNVISNGVHAWYSRCGEMEQ